MMPDRKSYLLAIVMAIRAWRYVDEDNPDNAGSDPGFSSFYEKLVTTPVLLIIIYRINGV